MRAGKLQTSPDPRHAGPPLHPRVTAARYPWLLFDADETLLDFTRAEADALLAAFVEVGVPWQDAFRETYHVVNARAWRLLEEGRITAVELRVRRFADMFEVLGLALDPTAFSPVYLRHLGEQANLVDGALELLDAVRGQHSVTIVTNGLSDVQRSRLGRSAIAAHIEHLVISEEVGAAKPDPMFFAIALERLGRPDPRDVLVIGDSLSSDIAGGIAAGLDTCWFNPAGKGRGDGPVPTYEIRSLAELPSILEG